MGKTDLTEGNVFKLLLRFSFPFMMATLLQTMYGMTDMMVIGRFVGSDGLSAASTGTQLMNLITLFCVGFSVAGQVLVSQKMGAKDFDAVKKINCTLCVIMFLLAVILTVVGILGCRTFLTWLNTPEEAFPYAASYVTVCSSGIVFTAFYNMFSAVFRGMGDSKHPLIFVAVAAGLNIVLDLIFVGPLKMSVVGAAYATVIGQGVSVATSLLFLLKHHQAYYFEVHPKRFKIDTSAISSILRLGFPMALRQSAISFSFLFVSGMVNQLGVIVSATFGAGQKIREIPSIVTQGLSLAGSSMVGQNMGAGKLDRVSKTSLSILKISLAVWILYGVALFFFPEQFFMAFTDDERVLAYASMLVLTILIEIPARSIMPGANAVVNGVGAARFALIVAFADAFLGRVLLTYLFGNVFGLGAFGYFLGYCLATYVTAIPEFIYFLLGKWKKRAKL